MIFFLFLFSFFPYIHSDCLEFLNNSLINECLIRESEVHNFNIDHYYSECLQCTIETFISSENIQFEENNQCLFIELQCIQLKFNTTEIFENFFQYHQQYLYDLFFKDHGTDQNTLHVIIKENTLEEINADYIENLFQIEFQAYRVLFFELHISNQNIQINRNLINLTRLSMKIILVCGEKNQLKQTIYIIHNRKIFLESKQDLCSTIFNSSLTTISSILSSSEILPIRNEKSKNIIFIIILLTGFLLGLVIILMIYCFKQIKQRYRRLSEKIETISERSISQDETPKLSLKLKRPIRGMRAIQLLDDDV